MSENTFSREYVQQLRQESAGRRKRIAELEAEVVQLRQDDPGAGEPERETTVEELRAETAEQQARASEADQRRREAELDAAIAKAAHGLGPLVENDRAALRMLVERHGEIEYGDAGDPRGVEDALRETLRVYPGLKAKPAPSMRERIAGLSSEDVLKKLTNVLRDQPNGKAD